jgi:ferredoxin--NADP+ reductase
MFQITSKTNLAPQVWRYSVEAPLIAQQRRAGNFVILRPTRHSERIPLTIVDSHDQDGTIDIIFQVVGATTMDLEQLGEKDSIEDIAGPLGHPTHIERYGRVAVVGGGVGIAPLLPIAKALKQVGNHLTAILGARSADYLILQDELKSISDNLLIATDDGSRGHKGLVTDVLKPLLDNKALDFVLAVGPVIMMKAVADLTRSYKIRTMASLNPLMIDGTGMCGVCRCKIDGHTKFACVDGPEFDAHQVDFDLLMRRLAMFKAEEKQKMEARQ